MKNELDGIQTELEFFALGDAKNKSLERDLKKRLDSLKQGIDTLSGEEKEFVENSYSKLNNWFTRLLGLGVLFLLIYLI